MNIRILSKNNIEKAIMKGIKDKTAIISFSDPVYKKRIDKSYRTVDFSQTNCRVFKVAVLDVDIQYLKDYELDYSSFFPEANDLAKFIKQAYNDGYDIICQCDYGQSRSAGCAAAIREYYYKDGIKIFKDYRYYPNQLIFNKVYKALKKIDQ